MYDKITTKAKRKQLYQSVAQQLIKIREEQGLLPEEIGERYHIPSFLIERLEKGNFPLRFEPLFCLCCLYEKNLEIHITD